MVECGGLENRCAARYRGFESPSLRQFISNRVRSRGLDLVQRNRFEPGQARNGAALRFVFRVPQVVGSPISHSLFISRSQLVLVNIGM